MSQPKDITKVLIIGSAPYMPEWWTLHGSGFREAGFAVCALNNAWSIPDRLPEWWVVQRDYFRFSPKASQPPQEVIKEMWKIAEELHSGLYVGPLRYSKKKCGGTTLLDALVFVLNYFIAHVGGEVSIAGCDLDYLGAKTHFYPNGTCDAIRCGPQWIIEELDKLKSALSDFPSLRVFNVGGNPRTILPFARAEISNLT